MRWLDSITNSMGMYLGKFRAFPMAQTIKNLPPVQKPQETRVGFLIREDPKGGGHGHPLQYSCLENPMDKGAWLVTDHRGTKSLT